MEGWGGQGGQAGALGAGARQETHWNNFLGFIIIFSGGEHMLPGRALTHESLWLLSTPLPFF